MKHLGITEKVIASLGESEYDALVVTGLDHIQYLSGAFIPFASARKNQQVVIYWPKYEDPIIICPFEWEGTIRQSGWVNQIVPYNASGDDPGGILHVLSDEISNLPAKQPSIGIDLERTPESFFQMLEKSFEKVKWTGCDDFLKDLRMIKTRQELDLIEQVALKTDHGINGAIHHVTIDKYQTALTLAEEIRVHTTERDLDLVGYHAASHVAAGKDTHRFWPMPPVFGFSRTRAFKEEDLVRMRMQATGNGYWSDATRIMTMGEPTEEQRKIYSQWLAVRDMILGELKPGVKVSEVYEKVVAQARNAGIPLMDDLPLGHGIGVTPEEPPFITVSDTTILEPNMVLVVAPVVHSASGIILWMKDTVFITEDGNRLVGWYKDWREPYIPIASI